MKIWNKTLVLDLDETLVHAHENPPRAAEFHVEHYGVIRRPGVESFLEFSLSHFENVGIWTASTLGYANQVLDQIVDRNRLSFVWDRSRCTFRMDFETREGEYLKDIRKLTRRGFNKEEIIFVDDTPAKISRSYGNLIAIRPFEGDPEDCELELLERYLRIIGDVPNVRKIEKRLWRNSVL